MDDWDQMLIDMGVANNQPMDGGQSNPYVAPPINAYDQMLIDTGDTLTAQTPLPYDAGGSSLDIAAFKADQAVRAAAIGGQPIQQSWLDTMANAGMDISKVASAGGALFRMVAGPTPGTLIAQPTNAAAINAQAAAKTKQTVLYAALGIAAFFFMS